MKKMLAFFTAAVCCFGAFTACGNKESSRPEGDNVPEKSAAPEQDDSGEEFTETFCKFFGSDDPVQMLEASLPDAVVESMKNIGGFETISETMAASVAQTMGDIQGIDAASAEYISQSECTPEICSRLEQLYSAYYGVYKTMDDNGISYQQYIAGDIDESKTKLISAALENYSKVGSGEDIDAGVSIKFEDLRLVTFSISGETAEFLMYKISGQNWKIDTIGLAVLEY